jgi:hypothetical protein
MLNGTPAAVGGGAHDEAAGLNLNSLAFGFIVVFAVRVDELVFLQ